MSVIKKNLKGNLLLLKLLLIILINACSKGSVSVDEREAVPDKIEAVSMLTINWDESKGNVQLNWLNPEDPFLEYIEVDFMNLSTEKPRQVIDLLEAKAGKVHNYNLDIANPFKYEFFVTALNKKGVRSETKKISLKPEEENIWLSRADTLMKALVKLYLDDKPRDIWSAKYPQGTGYWDGAAVIWGHGGAFSGYTAFKYASWNDAGLKSEIEDKYDNRLLEGVDKFINTRDGRLPAYAVYPGDGDERFYDDNIWIGIDMVRLYLLTGKKKYLDRAELVWKFILVGTDDIMGGGVYWKEDVSSKHTCSTAPAAVLGALLYQATKEENYLLQAEEYYEWVKNILQDPSDLLYWDNVRLATENDPDSEIIISKEKYTYNSGQPMQAAALLYLITKNEKYLMDAQAIAKAAHEKWFVPFKSYLLNDEFNILEPGHVWFQAIMLRGYVELYHIDNDITYLEEYRKTLEHAWLSNARNRDTHLINEDFRGLKTQNEWDILHQGAILEMLSQLSTVF